jgi:hypothetical protein
MTKYVDFITLYAAFSPHIQLKYATSKNVLSEIYRPIFHMKFDTLGHSALSLCIWYRFITVPGPPRVRGGLRTSLALENSQFTSQF